MSRRSEELAEVGAALKRLEEAVGALATALPEHASAIRAELRDVKSSAEAALAGVQALHAVVTPPPGDPARAESGTADGEPPVTRRDPKATTAKPAEKGM